MADTRARDGIIRRMESRATLLGINKAETEAWHNAPDGWRYQIDARWITFECGCRARRAMPLEAIPEKYDPIIFGALPEQAVYEHVCHLHNPKMNDRVRFGGFRDFGQWKKARFHVLTGLVAGRR